MATKKRPPAVTEKAKQRLFKTASKLTAAQLRNQGTRTLVRLANTARTQGASERSGEGTSLASRAQRELDRRKRGGK